MKKEDENRDRKYNENTEEKSEKEMTDQYYFNMRDPATNLRYDIPLLSTTDPGYYFKYIYFMKLKERSPETFEKAMRWD